ncbi:MAG: hypothetical protein WBS14_04775 [Rhodomicrobium sp.]
METLLGIVRSTTGKEPKCIDCKRHKLYPADPVLIFSSPKHRCTAVTDIVTGDTIETDCSAMRHGRCECGPDAKLFEARAKNGDAPIREDPLSSRRERGMSNVWIALLILGSLALLALIYWAYDNDTYQPHEKETNLPRVIRPGEVSLRKGSAKDGTCCVTARTRLMAIGKRSLWQVEVSPGNWRDCGNDCEQVLRKALDK